MTVETINTNTETGGFRDSRLWKRWEALCEQRSQIGDRRSAVSDEWKQTLDDGDRFRADQLWQQVEKLSREYDIADARVMVAWAHWIVQRYELREADVFYVTD